MRPRGWSLQCPCMPGRGSPGSQNQPLRAATRREALPVRHALQSTVGRSRLARSGQPVRELLVSGRLELLGQHQHPLHLVRSVRSSSAARPVATTRANAAARNSTSAKSPPAIPRSTSSTMRPQLLRPRRVRDPGDDLRHLGAHAAPRRTPVRPSPGRRRPTTAARTAATGSRRASRPATRTTPRRSSRCPRSRRGAAPVRRPPGRRCRARRAPAGWPRGRRPR